jgi:hypothetical protein
VGKRQKKENSTAEKADAETKTAAGAEAEGGAQLTQLLRVHLRKLPQQALLLASLSHPSLFLSLSQGFLFFRTRTSVLVEHKWDHARTLMPLRPGSALNLLSRV